MYGMWKKIILIILLTYLIIFFIENDTLVLYVYEHLFLLYMYYTWNDIYQNCLTINLNLKKKEIKKTKQNTGVGSGENKPLPGIKV